MSASSPRAFFFSATLHGLIAALVLFLTWSANRQIRDVTPIVQLVAGDGNNYMATEAPALGTPEGALDIAAPKLPAPEPARPEPLQPAPEPVQLTPAPPPVQKAPEKAPTQTSAVLKEIQRKISREKLKAQREVAKQRADEARRLAAEEKKKQAQMTKAEFDAKNKGKSAPSPSSPKSSTTKVTKIDAAGIAKGVVGGSAKNKTGGAGGKALVADEGSALDRYFSYLKQQMRAAFEPPPGLSDSLRAVIEFRSHADGTISNMRIERSSGSSEFDRAVLDALRKVSLPARPDRKSEDVQFTFSMREEDGG